MLPVVFIALMIAAVAAVAISEWLKFKRSANEIERRMWTASMAERVYTTCTFGGFRVCYRLQASLIRVDEAKFRDWAMYEPERLTLPLDDCHSAHVSPLLHPAGVWGYRYKWYADGSPGVSMYRMEFADGTLREHFDPNGCEFLRAAGRTDSGKPEPLYCGCTVSLMIVKPEWSEAILEENHKVITPEQHAEAVKSLEFQRFQEAVVIKALKLRHDLAQRTTEHRGYHYTLRASVVGTTVTIGLDLKDDQIAGKGRYRLVGFRAQGGFSDNALGDGSGNGVKIVDTRTSGSSVDHPPPGQTYYYTFFLNPDNTQSYRKYDLVRFEVHVPKEDDLAALKRLLDHSRAATSAADERRRKREKVLERLDLLVEDKQILIKFRRAKITEITKSPDYTDEEKQELIRALEDEINDLNIALA